MRLANLFKKWDESSSSKTNIARFVCSGLVQYSFFWGIAYADYQRSCHSRKREAALSNLNNLHRVIFREDPDGVIDTYLKNIKSGKLNIADDVPDDVLDLLKTATPADFNNSDNLAWHYVIREGVVWKVEEAPEGYEPESKDELIVLEMVQPEHN